MKASCCKLTCHEKLAWSPQVLSFCHCQYVLWRSFGERNSFLDKNTQKKPQGKKQQLYFVQQRNCDKFRVCSTSKWCDSRDFFQFVTCLAYKFEIKGQNTVPQREGLDQSFFGHTTETKKRAQYTSAKWIAQRRKENALYTIAVDEFNKS